MILFGKNITAPDDPLVKVPVEKIYHALRSPKSETTAHIRQLRIVRGIDKKRYSALKRQLPYMVCGIFAPPFRRSENFAYIEYFMLDIDHISEKGLLLSDLRQRVEADSRVRLSFVSPSEDGLKLLFRLKERCYDRGLFSLFYKAFAFQFARQYNIQQVIDNQTCDVTRACFVSIDPDAFYNPVSDPVDLAAILPQDNPTAMLDLSRQLKQEPAPSSLPSQPTDAVENAPEGSTPSQPLKKPDVDSQTIANIKAILNPQAKQRMERPVHVPEQLNDIIDDLKAYIEQNGVTVTEIINISYGKKIRTKLSMRQAEVNLFYGKRGFSVVKSPRTGTDDEFNEVMASLISTFLLGSWYGNALPQN